MKADYETVIDQITQRQTGILASDGYATLCYNRGLFAVSANNRVVHSGLGALTAINIYNNEVDSNDHS